jgi:plasmid stabilization system protein ParE
VTEYGLHPEALLELDEIWDFIRNDSVDSADRLIAEIHSAINTLLSFPVMGHKRPDLTSRPLRFILVRQYLIAYALDEPVLWVIAVFHGRRSPRIMAAILRDRE